MFKSIRSKVIVGLFILVVILGTIGYFVYQKYIKTKNELDNERSISIQNTAHWNDIVKQKSDSLQSLAGLVISLNKKEFDAHKKYISQTASLQLLIDSLRVKGDAISSNGEDSLGKFIKVDFEGTKSIVKYEGNTRHYLSLNRSLYSLDINFMPIDIFSTFYRDIDGLWKIKAVSNTPGITIKQDYKIDSLFYSIMNQMDLSFVDPPEEDNHIIGLRLRAGIAGSFDTNSWYNQHTFDLNAEFYYKYLYFSYYPLTKVASAGVYVDLDFTKVYNFMKKIF